MAQRSDPYLDGSDWTQASVVVAEILPECCKFLTKGFLCDTDSFSASDALIVSKWEGLEEHIAFSSLIKEGMKFSADAVCSF